jgi:hypothetical protein
MKEISVGCSLGVTLKFGDFENLKPDFWAGVKEDVSDSYSDEQVLERVKELQDKLRALCEAQVDNDVYDVKELKVFEKVKQLKEGK